jgi:hypothetical protein
MVNKKFNPESSRRVLPALSAREMQSKTMTLSLARKHLQSGIKDSSLSCPPNPSWWTGGKVQSALSITSVPPSLLILT